jgi:hypothetical protein
MIMMAVVLVHNDGLGAVVGINDNLDALVVGTAGASCEVISGYFSSIAVAVGLDTPDCSGVFLTKVYALKGGTASKGVFANETDSLREIDLTQIGSTLKGTSGYSATVRMNCIGGVSTSCRIVHKDPVLGTLIAYGIEYTVNGFVLVHVGPVNIT